MTENRLNELQEKIDFTRTIGFALHGRTNIDRADYDIFLDKNEFLHEYLVITYTSGAIAAVNCEGDSLEAIFDELAKYFSSGAPRSGADGYRVADEYHALRKVGRSVEGLRQS